MWHGTFLLWMLNSDLFEFFFQGIIGADGRHYILDLFRTFPPDANFLGGNFLSNLFFFSIVIDSMCSLVCKCLNLALHWLASTRVHP